jgi:hypothetical protein
MAIVAQNTALTPSQTKQQLPSNYVSYYDFTSQYKPDTHEEMASRYGKQSIAGALYLLGAEVASNADTFIWTEEGRLHTVYKDVARTGNVFTKANHVFRAGETVSISDNANRGRGVIQSVDKDTFTVLAFKSAGFASFATTNLTVFVDGSEHKKGTGGVEGSLQGDFTVIQNNPIILKDKFEVTGSDATNIGWIKTKQGYYWFLKDEFDTRLRWEDRLELAMLLGNKAEDGSDAQSNGYKGTEGLFEAIEKRGNLFQGAPTTLAEWDTILKRFDVQGKISDYMYYCDRDASLGVDDMLGSISDGGQGGVSYGIFKNGKDMALNLGFKGFSRGTYNFFKTDYKLLNDPTLLGAVAQGANKVRGLLLPLGTKEVYEGQNGKSGDKIKVPFVHTKYKASPTENRKYKTWVTGSVGMSAPTNDKDVMEVHHLSERAICAVGANNLMMMQGA